MQRWSTTFCLPMGSRQRVLLTLSLACAAWALLSFLSTHLASAAPAAPALGTTTQPDGTAFQSRVFGDEWAHGVETAAGYTVVQESSTGIWQFAARAGGNRLRPSGRVVGRDGPGHLPRHLRDQAQISEGIQLAASSPLPDPVPAPAPESFAAPSLATPMVSRNSLVLLATFNDQPSLGTTAASWHERFFGATGSLKHYYEEVSYGALTFAPAAESAGTINDGVVGWLPLDMAHPKGDNEASRLAVKAAVLAADPHVDYASFDTNGDGTLVPSELHITVIAAGYEGSFHTIPGNYVWGHRWALWGTVPPPVVDGTYVAGGTSYEAGYTTFGEMHNDHQATLGIIAHEIGHDLGWPDLYDTDTPTPSSSGVGNWSVMGGGSWGYLSGQQPGATPTHPDAWSKWFQGWLAPVRVTASTTGLPVNTAASPSNTNVVLQILDNPGGPTDWKFLGSETGAGEYFLVENRQRVGYDASLPGSGLLVWHVNEAQSNNRDDTNRMVDVIEADGLGHLDIAPGTTGFNRGDAGDPYPGTANKRSVSSTTTPSTKLNVSGAYSGVTIEAISSSGATMTADIHLPGANDTFAGATAMAGRSSTRSERITEATRQTGEPTACGVDRSVWFKYTAPDSGTVALSTAGSPFDTALGVFTGATLGDLTTVACNGNADGATTSALSFAATAGTTYYVQAGNDVGAHAGVGDLTLSMQSSPTAPVNTSASGGDASATVTWDPPASDGGSPITGYTVTSSPGDITAAAGATADQVTLTGLTNGVAYTFTVVATNAVGDSAASQPSAPVTPQLPIAVPTAPTQVWASATEGTTTVGWSPPLSDGGSVITGYTITALPSGTTTVVPAGTTQTTIAGLTSGLATTFTVTAGNEAGEGPASIASNTVTPIANGDPLVTMVAPNRTFTLTSTVVARWTATDASGVATHDVRWRLAPAGGAFGSWVYDPAWQGLTAAKASLGRTQAGYTYCFSVRSADTVGNTSGWTAPRCTTTPVDDRDLAPSAGGWSSKTALASYRATFRLSKLSGATLTLPSVRTKQVWLIATRCPGCGTVTVTVAGVKTRVPLDHATTQRKRLFPIAAYTTAKTVKVTVKVVSAGAGVQIDGLAATTQ